MNAVSLFSGVGGFELGFERAGITTVLHAERDPWALGVLAHHWPETRRVSDVGDVGVRRAAGDECGAPRLGGGLGEPDDQWCGQDVDLAYGGFPCQDISVAGKRAGLAGERSGLWFEFHRVLSELRPAWAVIENVAGLLSSNRGRDLAVILGGLEQLGYGWAYRVLDAQYAGVPQRRRRVFIVGCLGGRERAGAVLAVCEGCGGDSAPRRAPGEGTTGSLSAGTLRAGGANAGNNPGGGYLADVARVLSRRGRDGGTDLEIEDEPIAPSLRAGDGGSSRGLMVGPVLANSLDHDTYIPEVAWALQERDAKGPDSDTKEGHLLPSPAGVRRLTPRECERLMGWPDDHTRYAVMDGVTVEVADSHRYRMCGNGVVATVAEWLGRRLVEAN